MISSHPIISVIIPTYNRKNIILEAINSVLQQEPKNYEILLIDDGSTDGTEEYIKSLNLPIRYIRKENGGVSSARNKGIEMAEGSHVAFLDSDDVWLPNILNTQFKYLESHPGIPLVYCDQYIEADGKILPETRFGRAISADKNVMQKRFYLPGFVQHLPIHISSTMTRKSLFEEIGCFNEDLKIHEDIELWNRISEKYDLGYIEQPLAVFRWEKDTEHLMSAGNKERFVEEGRKYMKLYENLKKGHMGQEEERAIHDSYVKIEEIERDIK